jgi:predicted Zn-ribbon and HTH transcriptional regulator
MTIEYICSSDTCGYTFLDVVIIPKCKCPKCNAETDHVEWEGLPDDK